jgi:hypothetical protein
MDLLGQTSGMTNQGPRDAKGDLILPKLNLRSGSPMLPGYGFGLAGKNQDSGKSCGRTPA